MLAEYKERHAQTFPIFYLNEWSVEICSHCLITEEEGMSADGQSALQGEFVRVLWPKINKVHVTLFPTCEHSESLSVYLKVSSHADAMH